jgi:hypothetical protein
MKNRRDSITTEEFTLKGIFSSIIMIFLIFVVLLTIFLPWVIMISKHQPYERIKDYMSSQFDEYVRPEKELDFQHFMEEYRKNNTNVFRNDKLKEVKNKVKNEMNDI